MGITFNSLVLETGDTTFGHTPRSPLNVFFWLNTGLLALINHIEIKSKVFIYPDTIYKNPDTI